MSRISLIFIVFFLSLGLMAQHHGFTQQETIQLDRHGTYGTLTFDRFNPVRSLTLVKYVNQRGYGYSQSNQQYQVQATFGRSGRVRRVVIETTGQRGRKKVLTISKRQRGNGAHVVLTGRYYTGYNRHYGGQYQSETYYVTLTRGTGYESRYVNFNITSSNALYSNIIAINALKQSIESYLNSQDQYLIGVPGARQNLKHALKRKVRRAGRKVLDANVFDYIRRSNSYGSGNHGYGNGHQGGQNNAGVWSFNHHVQRYNYNVDRHTTFQSVPRQYILLKRVNGTVLTQYKLKLGFQPELEVTSWTYRSYSRRVISSQQKLTIRSQGYRRGFADFYTYDVYQRGHTSAVKFKQREVERVIRLLKNAAGHNGRRYIQSLRQLSYQSVQNLIQTSNTYRPYGY